MELSVLHIETGSTISWTFHFSWKACEHWVAINKKWLIWSTIKKNLKLTDLIQSSYFTNGETEVEEHWGISPGPIQQVEAELETESYYLTPWFLPSYHVAFLQLYLLSLCN